MAKQRAGKIPAIRKSSTDTSASVGAASVRRSNQRLGGETRFIWICALLIVGAVVFAWANSFFAPFELDDQESIVANETIRDLRSFHWLRPPSAMGETVSGRPILNLSFAINHAIGGESVRGYHVVNVAIHALAALVLFGVVRRTLALYRGRSGALTERSTPVDARKAVWVALAATLLWALHPLQTAAVTYIVQRAESLAGLFYLLTLYGLIRSAESREGIDDASRRVSRRWAIGAMAACLLGVGTKETLVTAPIVVLLYDRTFLAGSFRDASRARGRMHLALLATWVPLAFLVITNHGRGGSAGLASAVDAWTYLLTQCEAVVHYLRLTFWPSHLVFDYGVHTVSGLAAVWSQALLLIALFAVTAIALWRNRAVGFLGAWFFLILAPSSSIVPVATQTIAEHRMYLPLAALAALVCAVELPAAWRGAIRLRVVLLAVVILAMGAATFSRNAVYASSVSLWRDTVAKRPDNARARSNFGLALMDAGDDAAAADQFREAIRLQPNHAFAHFNLAALFFRQARWDEAAEHFRAALTADPGLLDARINLGDALARLGRIDEAIGQYEDALKIAPDAQDARVALAALFIRKGDWGRAEGLLRESLGARPDLADAHFRLGVVLAEKGASEESRIELMTALRLQPSLAAASVALGNSWLKAGDLRQAEAAYRDAVSHDPALTDGWFALGNVVAKQGRYDEAEACFSKVVSIVPAHVQARTNLGNCQLATGHFHEAIASYEQVLAIQPENRSARENVEIARRLLAESGSIR